MNFIKKNIKIITAFVLGMIVTGGIVGATVYQYQASDIKYGNTTVGAAVNNLYGAVNAQGTGGINIKNYVGSAKNASTTLTCPSGKMCVAYTYCYNMYNSSYYCSLNIDSNSIGSDYSNTNNSYGYVASYSNSYILGSGQKIQYWGYNANSYVSLFSN